MSEYHPLSSLDEAQAEAVRAVSGSCEVIAGPGSGKTTVLIEHILYLIHAEHVPPERILVLTFSREAALHLRNRFFSRVRDSFENVTFGTFHSVLFHILISEGDRPYRLLDPAAKEVLIRGIAADYSPKATYEYAAAELEQKLSDPARASDPDVMAYLEYMRENDLIDYERVIEEGLRFLTSEGSAAQSVRQKYSHVLVDEFQDIDPAQYDVLMALSSHGAAYVVGDDDQSIYGFRGSTPAVFERFMRDHPGAARLFLSINYRCSDPIVRASSALIKGNRLRVSKSLRAAKRGGLPVSMLRFVTEDEEVRYIAGELRQIPLDEQPRTAIICRTNRQSQRFHNKLHDAGLSATVRAAGRAGSTNALLREVRLDLSAYGKLHEGLSRLSVPQDAFFRVMNRPQRYLYRRLIRSEHAAPADLVRAAASQPAVLGTLMDLFDDCEFMFSLPPYECIRYLFDRVGYREHMIRSAPDAEEMAAVLSLVEEEALKYCDMQSLIERLTALERTPFYSGAGPGQEGGGRRPDKGKDEVSGGVYIMTMHACKGLEFDRVFLPDLNEGLVPSHHCTTDEEIEEERRLLYVGMTRAIRRLDMMYVTGRASAPKTPSRFLSVYGVNSFVQYS